MSEYTRYDWLLGTRESTAAPPFVITLVSFGGDGLFFGKVEDFFTETALVDEGITLGGDGGLLFFWTFFFKVGSWSIFVAITDALIGDFAGDFAGDLAGNLAGDLACFVATCFLLSTFGADFWALLFLGSDLGALLAGVLLALLFLS